MKKLGMKIQGVKKWQLSNISEPCSKTTIIFNEPELLNQVQKLQEPDLLTFEYVPNQISNQFKIYLPDILYFQTFFFNFSHFCSYPIIGRD